MLRRDLRKALDQLRDVPTVEQRADKQHQRLARGLCPERCRSEVNDVHTRLVEAEMADGFALREVRLRQYTGGASRAGFGEQPPSQSLTPRKPLRMGHE